MTRIFGPFCRTFFVPWESVTVTRKTVLFSPTVKLQFGDPVIGTLRIYAHVADRLARGEPVEIFGDGQQVRDFTYVGDAVCALGRALRAASTSARVFNVCTGTGTTVQALAETMAALHRTELVAYYRPARSSEVRVSIGDPRQAAEQLGFKAKTALTDGLAITLNLPRPR